MSEAPLSIEHFAGWLAYGERGLSSEAIVHRLTGGRVRSPHDHPHDPADFRRCQLLLDAYPLARLHLGLMRDVSPQWRRLVDRWGEIERALATEVPDYGDRRSRGSAWKTYLLMRCAIEDAEPCATCDGTGRGDECVKCRGTGRRSGGRCRAVRCWNGAAPCADCRGEGYVKRAAA